MIELMRSCLARLGCLTLLVAGAVGAWYVHDDVVGWWEARNAPSVDAAPTTEIADRAETRLRRFLDADGEAELRLGESEVSSLVRYRIAEMLPSGVSDPAASLQDSTARVTAILDAARMLEGRVPPMLIGMLGDSARVTVELLPGVPRPGTVRLDLLEVRAGALQVPRAMVPWLVEGLGLPAAPGGGGGVQFATTMEDLAELRVEDRHLVLIRGPSGTPP
ncbi:MAG: hypothetical protein ACOC83_01705 [Gemmatimonadota bacterium]